MTKLNFLDDIPFDTGLMIYTMAPEYTSIKLSFDRVDENTFTIRVNNGEHTMDEIEIPVGSSLNITIPVYKNLTEPK